MKLSFYNRNVGGGSNELLWQRLLKIIAKYSLPHSSTRNKIVNKLCGQEEDVGDEFIIDWSYWSDITRRRFSFLVSSFMVHFSTYIFESIIIGLR